jgi:hypothetical protein
MIAKIYGIILIRENLNFSSIIKNIVKGTYFYSIHTTGMPVIQAGKMMVIK